MNTENTFHVLPNGISDTFRNSQYVATRRSKWIWISHALLIILFPVAAVVYGPFGMVIGMLATALGAGRAVALWNSKQRFFAVALAVWLVLIVATMLLPIWSHPGLPLRGDTAPVYHYHYIWQLGHIH